MLHTLILVIHITGACGALVTGFLALNISNGTRTHRLLGKLYLVMWLLLTGAGAVLGSDDGGISVFEILNLLGVTCVAIAYSAVLFRRRIGPRWLRHHYNWMVSSLAFLVIATINQVLPRLGITYPMWVFVLMVASPSLVIPWYIRRLDRRYGFAKAPERAAVRQASNEPAR
jgi:uncharacterized membrane protein